MGSTHLSSDAPKLLKTTNSNFIFVGGLRLLQNNHAYQFSCEATGSEGIYGQASKTFKI